MGGVSFLKLEDNRENWINRVNDFNASNLSQTTWAKNNGINVSALRYWLKKLDNSNGTSLEGSLTPFEFASVSITGKESLPSVVLEINDVKLSITDDFDETLLLRIIKALRKL